jgi:hypothetical protein
MEVEKISEMLVYTGCSAQGLIGHSFYRPKFLWKCCATCQEKCRCTLIISGVKKVKFVRDGMLYVILEVIGMISSFLVFRPQQRIELIM